jgi:hypothetical protein
MGAGKNKVFKEKGMALTFEIFFEEVWAWKDTPSPHLKRAI